MQCVNFRRRVGLLSEILDTLQSTKDAGVAVVQSGSGLPVPELSVEKADSADSCLVSWKYRTTSVKQQLVHIVSIVGHKFRPSVNSTVRLLASLVYPSSVRSLLTLATFCLLPITVVVM